MSRGKSGELLVLMARLCALIAERRWRKAYEVDAEIRQLLQEASA